MKINPLSLVISTVFVIAYAICELFDLTKTQSMIDKILNNK